MSLDGIVFQVSLQCASCMQPVHVQGLAEQALCPACSKSLDLPREKWLGWFGPGEVAEALGLGEGEARQVTSLGGSAAKYAYGHRMPRCQTCKVEVPPDRLPELAQAGFHTCSCGERVRVREAPELARLLVPGARFAVNEGATADGSAAAEPSASAEPVLFACMGCGGSLTVDGRDRNLLCRFCGASNYLPDGLWLRLHPPQTVRTFFVVLERGGKSVLPAELLEKLSRSSASDSRRIAAESPDLPAGVLRTLSADDDDDVRAAVAENPSAPIALVDRLLADSYYQVRAAAVRSGRASDPALCDQLARESDSDVLEAADKANLSAGAVAALAANTTYRARRSAASHPNASDATLIQLASDTDSDVIAALAARHDLPAAAIWKLASSEDEKIAENARSRPQYKAARARRLKIWLAVAVFALVIVACVGGTGGLAWAGWMASKALLHHR
jgi:hypothetical protein